MGTKKIVGVISIVVGGVLIIFLMLRFIYGGPEDFWVCAANGWVKHGNPRDPKPDRECVIANKDIASTTTSLANPASVFCLDQDGILEFRADVNGNQYAICVFDDGRACEEWEFYRTKKCGSNSTPQSQGGEMEKIPTF